MMLVIIFEQSFFLLYPSFLSHLKLLLRSWLILFLYLKENSTNGFKFLSSDVTASQYALVLSSTRSRLGLDILGSFSLVGRLCHS